MDPFRSPPPNTPPRRALPAPRLRRTGSTGSAGSGCRSPARTDPGRPSTASPTAASSGACASGKTATPSAGSSARRSCWSTPGRAASDSWSRRSWSSGAAPVSRAEAAGRPVFEFRAAGAAWDAEFLERVAIRWAHAPIGLGLLVERHAGRPAPFLVPSTPEGAMLVASAADGLPGRLHRRSALPAGPEAPGGSVAFAVLAPSGGPAPEVRPGSPDEPRTLGGPAPTPLPFRPAAEGFDDHPGVSVQWHWFPGGPEGLRVWAR